MMKSPDSDLLELNDLTQQIRQLFAENVADNNKWLLLNKYTLKYLKSKSYSSVLSNSYCSVSSVLIDSLDCRLFSDKKDENIFDETILCGPSQDAILILVNKFQESGQGYKQKKLLNLLRHFIENGRLEDLLYNQCISKGDWNLKYVSASNVWNNIVTYLVSLPERISNKSPGHRMKIFYPVVYVHLIISTIFKILDKICHLNQDLSNYSLEFIGLLISKLCSSGYADICAKRLCAYFIILYKRTENTNAKSRKFIPNLISSISSVALESFITQLLLAIPWYGYVEGFLDEEGVKNERIRHIMMTKLLLVRTFENHVILRNIIGYYASSADRLPQFKQLVKSLIDYWASPSSFKHQSFEQKLYLSSALMICAGWLKKIKVELLPTGCTASILQGIEIRLKCSDEKERYMGMFVGQNLLAVLEPSAPDLNFEYDGKASETVHFLKGLMEIEEKTDKDLLSFFEEDLKYFDEKVAVAEPNSDGGQVKSACNELDSDDDLEPYDMSNDSSSRPEDKHPLYLTDCMKGLIEQEDASWTEQCLIHAEKLIKDKTSATHEVSVEFAKILLHLDDKFEIPNFSFLKQKSLVALTVEYPFEVPKYLASQFHTKDYTISQRLEILDALGTSSQTLSQLKYDTPEVQFASSKRYLPEAKKEWHAVIEKRLEAKTKRFFKMPRKQNLPATSQNKFLPVAGNFFFPLLKFSEEKLPYFLEEDSYLLGRFIYTLGIIMLNAANNVHCLKMGTDLLLFVESKVKHSDTFVRQSAIYAITTIFISVPGFILFTDMLPEVKKSYEWLEDIVNNDPDLQCKERALYSLGVFQGIAKEESPSITFS